MKLYLRDECEFARLYCFGDDAFVVGFAFDGDVLGASEVTFKVDDLEILNIEEKEVGFLLVDNRVFLANFYSRVDLSNLLFV